MDSTTERGCTDLSDISKNAEIDDLSGLCAVCRRVNFASATRDTCPAHIIGEHFHVGTLQDVLSKHACAGCRLILAAIASDPNAKQYPVQSLVRLNLGPFSQQERRAPGTGTDTPDGYVDSVVLGGLFDVLVEGQDSSSDAAVAGTIIRYDEPGWKYNDECPPEKDETPEERYFGSGRGMTPQVSVELIKKWIRSCDDNHHECRDPEDRRSDELQFRLFDVQERRIVPASFVEDYVALSYVWGKAKPLSSRDTVQTYTISDSPGLSAVSRTIYDAIRLVEAVGKRYFWADALCILQNDLDDKRRQLAIMDQIYRHASLLIVAAAGSDAHHGLPGFGDTGRRISQQIETIGDLQFTAIQPSLQTLLSRTAWQSRGWTFQEALLSRRALIFTETQVLWSCQAASSREDTHAEALSRSVTLDHTNSIWGAMITSIKGLTTTDHTFTPCRTSTYCFLVETFTTRSFTVQSDVLWGFTGLLRLLAPKFKQGFIWGLPYERLDATLLWSETRCCPLRHPRRARHGLMKQEGLQKLEYPSWSWLSTRSGVTFVDGCGDSVVSEVKWHEPIIQIESGHTEQATGGDLEAMFERLQTQGSTLSAAESSIVDYALLSLTARTTILTMRTNGKPLGGYHPIAKDDVSSGYEPPNERGSVAPSSQTRLLPDYEVVVVATAVTSDGKEVGKLLVPSSFFRGRLEQSGEFVLLSSNTNNEADDVCVKEATGLDCGNIRHVRNCGHIQSRNVMLIEWIEGVAHRVGLMRVNKARWDGVETRLKDIVLG